MLQFAQIYHHYNLITNSSNFFHIQQFPSLRKILKNLLNHSRNGEPFFQNQIVVEEQCIFDSNVKMDLMDLLAIVIQTRQKIARQDGLGRAVKHVSEHIQVYQCFSQVQQEVCLSKDSETCRYKIHFMEQWQIG